MPSSVSTVELTINGVIHDRWEAYEIDSDLLVPADAWHMSLGMANDKLPDAVQPGMPVSLKVDGELVLSGFCDEVNDAASRSKHSLELQGRDGASVLLDCSAPVFTATLQSLEQIITKIVRPLGVTKIRIDADATLLRERVSTEPGDTAWSTLQRAAEANGLWPWFDPDGTLVIGGPDYSIEPVAELVLRRDGKGGNVTKLERKRNSADRFSNVTVLGQAHSGMFGGAGQNNVRGEERDTGVTSYRPRILVDHEAQTVAIARARGRKFISDSRLKAYELRAEVPGHRTGAAPAPLWKPGQRVRVVSEPHEIDAVFFLIGRAFVQSPQGGQFTRLKFKEDGVWVLDAHPHKRMHRRGRNSMPGKVIDLSGGAQ